MLKKALLLTVGLSIIGSVYLLWNIQPQGNFARYPIAYGQGTNAPPSTLIQSLEWAPADTVMRAAQGSDNFPLTWADDGNLYTAYGDGFGFEPRLSTKLSLGFARVSGGPTDFVGTNIRSGAEVPGDGPQNEKSSGMLMVDGVLYMWVRNIHHIDNQGMGCQLAWSTDYAVTWTRANWEFADFGFCTFVNYGQNYAGARDDYVYMVTHNHPSAYVGTNDFILARAPQGELRDDDAWEFFRALDSSGSPLWTPDIDQRGPIFSRTDGMARRSSMTYNSGLGRYIWWQGYPNTNDVRDAGGIGIYEAPEPWGPWSQIYHTYNWDIGPGDLGGFPTKWMSDDGLVIYLAFSGNDTFSVRKATLTLYATPTPTPTATAMPTFTPTATQTPTPTPSNTPTFTVQPTGTNLPTATPTATPTFRYDRDNDGIPDVYEDVDNSGTIEDDDTDGDGLANYQDADDDGDGIPTHQEIGDAPVDAQMSGAPDHDDDGVPDYLDADDDGDGTPTQIEGLADRNDNGAPDYLDRTARAAVYIPFSAHVVPTPTPTLGPIRVIELPILDQDDDVEELANGEMDRESETLDVEDAGASQIIGLRYPQLDIPQGAQILSAHLRVRSESPSSGPATMTIVAESTDFAVPYYNTYPPLSARPRTGAQVVWDVPEWTAEEAWQLSPDIRPVIQEVVNRPGWDRHYTIGFLITGSGTRPIESYNLSDHDGSPRLYVEFRE